MRQSLGRWYDFSAGWPGAAAIKASGAVGILVYIGEGSQGKRITGAQYRQAIAAGLLVRFVCELNIHDAEVGWVRGVEFAHATLADFDARGIPRDQFVACAADEHLTQAQLPTAVDFARGFESVIGAKAGCYGFREFIRACIGVVGSWYWLAGSPPPADLDDWVLFWQRNDGTTWVSGIQVDINEQLLPVEDTVTGPVDLNPGQQVLLAPAHLVILQDMIARVTELVQMAPSSAGLGDHNPQANALAAKLEQLAAKVDAGFGALSDDEAKILAALRELPTGGQVDVPALAAALASIGTLVARVPDDQIEHLLAEIDKMPVATRQQLAAALAGETPA